MIAKEGGGLGGATVAWCQVHLSFSFLLVSSVFLTFFFSLLCLCSSSSLFLAMGIRIVARCRTMPMGVAWRGRWALINEIRF